MLAAVLHDALEAAQGTTQSEVIAGLVYILRLGKARAEEIKTPLVDNDPNLDKVIEFNKQFLKEADGGARLAAAWGVFTSLLSETGEVKIYPPNQADRYSKTAGDVEVFYNDVLASASECKHRPLNADDVKHGIRKANEHTCPEYLFVCAEGIAHGQKDEVSKIIVEAKGKLDVEIINILDMLPLLAAMLNPKRRALFGTEVTEQLRKMRRFESANYAADLWNSL